MATLAGPASSHPRLRVLFLSKSFPNKVFDVLGLWVENLVRHSVSFCEPKVISPVQYCPPLPGLPVAALRILENETQQQQQAVASSQESLQLFTNRYKGGVDAYLQVITAQTIELANERNAIDILRRRLDASVLLIKALGGGWNVSNLPTFGASSVRDY